MGMIDASESFRGRVARLNVRYLGAQRWDVFEPFLINIDYAWFEG